MSIYFHATSNTYRYHKIYIYFLFFINMTEPGAIHTDYFNNKNC